MHGCNRFSQSNLAVQEFVAVRGTIEEFIFLALVQDDAPVDGVHHHPAQSSDFCPRAGEHVLGAESAHDARSGAMQGDGGEQLVGFGND